MDNKKKTQKLFKIMEKSEQLSKEMRKHFQKSKDLNRELSKLSKSLQDVYGDFILKKKKR